MKPQTIARLKRRVKTPQAVKALITKKPKLPKDKNVKVVRGFARAR